MSEEAAAPEVVVPPHAIPGPVVSDGPVHTHVTTYASIAIAVVGMLLPGVVVALYPSTPRELLDSLHQIRDLLVSVGVGGAAFGKSPAIR